MINSLGALGALTLLTACTTYTNDTAVTENQKLDTEDLQSFITLIADTFETATSDKENNMIDRRVRVDAPGLDGEWLYYQLNTGKERKVYRQRLSHLTLAGDGSAIIQETFTINDPAAFVNAWENPSLLRGVTADDYGDYFDTGCEQRWTQTGENAWSGYVNPATCQIFSERRQANIHIEAEALLDDTTLRQTERGFDEDGNQLFGSEPGDFIILYRQ